MEGNWIELEGFLGAFLSSVCQWSRWSLNMVTLVICLHSLIQLPTPESIFVALRRSLLLVETPENWMSGFTMTLTSDPCSFVGEIGFGVTSHLFLMVSVSYSFIFNLPNKLYVLFSVSSSRVAPTKMMFILSEQHRDPGLRKGPFKVRATEHCVQLQVPYCTELSGEQR